MAAVRFSNSSEMWCCQIRSKLDSLYSSIFKSQSSRSRGHQPVRAGNDKLRLSQDVLIHIIQARACRLIIQVIWRQIYSNCNYKYTCVVSVGWRRRPREEGGDWFDSNIQIRYLYLCKSCVSHGDETYNKPHVMYMFQIL